MSEAPFVSVVIPTYSRADDLRRCLHSVLASDCDALEVVVSDNCSPDNTQAVLAEFGDPRVRKFRQDENLGGELNMAFVLEQARGDWVITLTDDDWLMPTAIATLRVVLAQVTDVGFVLSPLKQIDPRGYQAGDHLWFEKASRDPALQISVFEPGPASLQNLFWHGHVFTRWCMRRDVIDIAGYRRQIGRHLYSPMWMTSSALLNAKTVFVNQPLCTHRILNQIHWSYPDDFMYGGVLDMLAELLADAPATLKSMEVTTAARALGQVGFVASKGPDRLERYAAALLRIPAFAAMDRFDFLLEAAVRKADVPEDQKARAASIIQSARSAKLEVATQGSGK